MSGAVVFAEDDVVVGVISGHHRSEGLNSLTVTPITAVRGLPDAAKWWQLLGAESSSLVHLPGPPVSDDGLHVWTAADFQAGLEFVADPGEADPIEPGEPVDVALLRQGRLPNLQQEFERMGPVFDDWLAPGPQHKGGRERIRMLWLVADPGQERSEGLLACLSRAAMQGRAVYDARRDLGLAASTLSRSVLNPGFALPPLVAVDLQEDQTANPWARVNTIVTKAAKQSSVQGALHLHRDDPYPRMIVAGTIEQEAAQGSGVFRTYPVLCSMRRWGGICAGCRRGHAT
jgi:hypothetical protein